MIDRQTDRESKGVEKEKINEKERASKRKREKEK